MDFKAPVSQFMSTKLITVTPRDRMSTVKEIFDTHRIHHIPVVKFTSLVGIISKTDYLHFLKGANINENDHLIENSRLHNYLVEDVMTKGLATLESTERVNVALEILSENLFHAIPIVKNEELVGMFTTFDVIKALMEEDRLRMLVN